MMDDIVSQLDGIYNRSIDYFDISETVCRETRNRIKAQYYTDPPVRFRSSLLVHSYCIEDMDPSEATRIFFSFGIPENEEVVLIWGFRKRGITLPYGVFARYYFKLWYPGADDVWVTNENIDWLIELHHEEYLSIARAGE